MSEATVSCDGTWQRRGFSSHNGIATVLSVAGNHSKVLDVECLSNYCNACSVQRSKKNPEQFEEWYRVHQTSCEKNYEGSAGGMEPAGMKNIFRRADTERGLKYTKYLGDGDSKAYLAVAETMPYEIEKLECCGHIQKRMGKRLMDKVTEYKNTQFVDGGKKFKGIGGVGRLSQKAIKRIQGHYGGAIRANPGDVAGMRKAIWAVWKHRGDDHDDCGNWCPTKTRGEPNKNVLPKFVLNCIKPVFEALSDTVLLQKCAHGGSQNTNESFHNLIWERCPKTSFVGRQRLEIAVFDAAIVYNEGELSRLDILKKLKLKPGIYTKQGLEALDKKRIQRAYIPGQASVLGQRRHRAVQSATQSQEYVPGGF